MLFLKTRFMACGNRERTILASQAYEHEARVKAIKYIPNLKVEKKTNFARFEFRMEFSQPLLAQSLLISVLNL